MEEQDDGGRVGWNEPLGGQLQCAADAMKVADGRWSGRPDDGATGANGCLA
jgi:hypothetical protein